MNIVIMDGYASNPGDLNWDALKQLGDVTVYPRTSDAEKVERAKDADIILINKVQMDAETIAQLPDSNTSAYRPQASTWSTSRQPKNAALS